MKFLGSFNEVCLKFQFILASIKVSVKFVQSSLKLAHTKFTLCNQNIYFHAYCKFFSDGLLCGLQHCIMCTRNTLNLEIFANSKFRELGSNLVGRKIQD